MDTFARGILLVLCFHPRLEVWNAALYPQWSDNAPLPLGPDFATRRLIIRADFRGIFEATVFVSI